MKQRCVDAEALKNSLESPVNGNSGSQNNANSNNVNNVVTDFSKRKCTDFKHLGYECVPQWKCINGKFDASAR